MNTELEKIAYVYGDVCVRRKKQRRRRQRLLVLELLFEYAKNSTLHGLRYIVDQGLNILERCFWFLTVIVSIVLCSVFIFNVVHKWRTAPVIVTVNGQLSSVGSVPFPAVMICPQIKVNQQNYNYTEQKLLFENASLHGEALTKFLNTAVMCENFKMEWYQTVEKFANSSLVNDITEAAQSADDIFFLCYLQSMQNIGFTKCNTLFQRVITEHGVCYTTNSLAARDIFKDTIQSDYPYMKTNDSQRGWSLEKGYNYSENDFYPRRGQVMNSVIDMTLVMRHNSDSADKTCNRIFSGYKIYLHHPADFPQTSMYYYAALSNQTSSVAINFHEFNSDTNIIAYDAKIRQCYFPSERQLRYFKLYTATNCKAECLSNYTYRLCNCVGMYMPHNDSKEICHPVASWNCMWNAKDVMGANEGTGDLGLEDGECNCLPSCNTVEYDAEILKTDFHVKEYFQKELGFDDDPATSYSKVDLFYKKSQFVTMQRRELFGFTDLLANIGGLLGLFLGFSFLSLIEIFYFLTVRVGFILKRDLEDEKSKEKSKMGDDKRN